nr:hypothetical protein [Castellaniella sp.]
MTSFSAPELCEVFVVKRGLAREMNVAGAWLFHLEACIDQGLALVDANRLDGVWLMLDSPTQAGDPALFVFNQRAGGAGNAFARRCPAARCAKRVNHAGVVPGVDHGLAHLVFD